MNLTKSLLLSTLFGMIGILAYGQHRLSADVFVNPEVKTLTISETITYVNESDDVLSEIFLNDWANAFSAKTTPLAKRFAQNYSRKFHYASKNDWGSTKISSIRESSGTALLWKRPNNLPDIIRIGLPQQVAPGESYTFQLNYQVRVPEDRFTEYGFSNGNFKMRYWLITPSVYDGNWEVYSHKNLGDQFVPELDLDLTLRLPTDYNVISDLAKNESPESFQSTYKKVILSGKNRNGTKLYLVKDDFFEQIQTDQFDLITDIKDTDVQPEIKALIIDRIGGFLNQRLGDYPLDELMVTQEDYLNSPVYGLNQLPHFIRPFPDGFQYDIKMMKTITNAFLKNTILLNPRKEKWVHDAIQISLMMDYVETYYPNTKLIGNLSKVIGLRWFHAADLQFNDQYPFFFMNMQRLNLDQPMTTSIDSLVKFNKNIANPYKAGSGITYLEDFIGKEPIKKSIKEFYLRYALKPVNTNDFQQLLKSNSSKNIDWFFNEFVETNKRIDFKIKKIKKSKDSLAVTVENKEKNHMPVSLYGLKDGEIVSKYWVEDVDKHKTLTIPRQNIDKVALNYEARIPEFNQRDNYKRVTTLFDKPLQFRLLQDVEDPKYQQIFLIPEFDYNLYDGVNIGPKLYNSTVLYKNFTYKIAPKYGFTSGAVVGSASIYKTKQFQNQKLHAVRFGLSGTRYSYAKDLYYHKVTPFLTFAFRNKYLRSNEAQSLSIRSVNVIRDRSEINPVDEPDYSVFDLKYNYSNRNFLNYFTTSLDYQVAKSFSKVSVTSKWRKLFLNNRQLEFRIFAGAFLFNDKRDSDYFSFALDRPTDYLFDYNYYGRSESSGLFSQQYIEAEGGFKSQLQPKYANQWITTANTSATIWNFIYAYGDVGLLKNHGESAKFVYDSGVRVSLVQDYFELFFPVYSNLGWEIAQPDYDQKIRFIVSLDISTLLKLFKRRWY